MSKQGGPLLRPNDQDQVQIVISKTQWIFSLPHHEILINVIAAGLLVSVEYEHAPVQTLIPDTNTNALPFPRLPTPRTRRRRHFAPTRLLRRLRLLLHNHSGSLFLSTRLLRCSRCILLINLPNQRNLSRKPLLERLCDEEAIGVEPARKRRRQLRFSFSTLRIGGCDSDVVDRHMFRYGGGYRELLHASASSVKYFEQKTWAPTVFRPVDA